MKLISRWWERASLDAQTLRGCANQRRRQNNSSPQLTTLRASRAACVAFIFRLCLKCTFSPTLSERRSVLTTLRKKVDFRNVAFLRTPKSSKKHENTRLGLLIYVFFGENGPPTLFWEKKEYFRKGGTVFLKISCVAFLMSLRELGFEFRQTSCNLILKVRIAWSLYLRLFKLSFLFRKSVTVTKLKNSNVTRDNFCFAVSKSETSKSWLPFATHELQQNVVRFIQFRLPTFPLPWAQCFQL